MAKNKKLSTYDIAMQVIKEECRSCNERNKCTRDQICDKVIDKVIMKYKEKIEEKNKNENTNL